MSQLQALRAASSLSDVANLLGFSSSALAYVVYKNPNKYTSFTIPKRGGGQRLIKAPTPELKLLQQNLSTLIQNSVKEINEKRSFADELSHGFKPGRSIITNAFRHRKRRYVFNIDLEDFFGTINFGRVRGFFIKDANLMLAPKVATLLAQIACDDNSLPQGSPCSPAISSLVGHILDIRLSRFASNRGCIYSRYADDISFSTNKPTFPSGIASQIAGEAHKWEAGAKLQKLVTSAGFSINPTKTRMQYRDSRQSVTGLLVNKKVNIRSEYRRTVRAMAQRLFVTGEFEYESTIIDASGAATAGKVKGNIEQLHGMFGHIDLVDRHNEEQESTFDSGSKAAKKDARDNLYSKQAIYRRFLIFKDFYSAKRPMVVCEGKTDNIVPRHNSVRL
jgi:RNA-directed DNA polymerase